MPPHCGTTWCAGPCGRRKTSTKRSRPCMPTCRPVRKALSEARAELVRAAGTPVAAQPRRHWGRWVAAGVTVAALVATALVVQTVGDKPASSAAAQTLNSAADKIGAQD